MDLHTESFIKLIFMSCISLSCGFYSLFYIHTRIKCLKQFKKLKGLRDTRILQKRENLIKFEKYLSKLTVADTGQPLIDKSFSEILDLLKSSQQYRDQILYAYQKRAFEVNSQLNCVVDFLEITNSEINFNGPLAGLPISVKDNFFIKNYYSCAGLSYFLSKTVDTNSVLIDVIKDLGGVPFVKTTVPQSMMSFLSSNPIDGITLNPIDSSKSPGGSSSGESALIGGHGSILGLGTDIGGSIRLPAAFCGVVGFKPTVGRLSKKGLLSWSKNGIVNGVCGILGRDVESIAYLFEHIVNSPLHRSLDPTVVPIDFNKQLYESKLPLKIGYFIYNDSYRCVPAMERIVLETVKRLEQNGHRVVKWKPPISGEQSMDLFLRAFGGDRAKDIRRVCQFDEKDFCIKNMLKMFELNYFQYLYKLLQAHLMGNKESIMWLKASRGISSCEEVTKLMDEINQLRCNVLDDWYRLGIDMVICPAGGFTALPVKPSGSLTGMLSYLNLWNLIDFPAGTVSVSTVNDSDISQLIERYPKHLSTWHSNTYKGQIDSINMPVSVQCVSKPWQEELCLRIMKDIQN